MVVGSPALERRTRRGPRVPVWVLLLALAQLSCSLALRLSGPKWSNPRPPIEIGARAADHTGERALRLLVFGDAGTGGPEQLRVGERMAEECARRGGCDLALMTGDNIYEVGVRRATPGGPDPRFRTRFEIPYEPLGRLDLWAVPGNHDWYSRGSIEAQVAYTRLSPRWRMPAADYAVPGLPPWLRIYGLDTTALLHGHGGDQIERARDALCGGGDGWRLLFGHHPVYSSGLHADRHGELPALRDRLLEPLIERCGVQLYLAGHDHHQEHLQAPAFDQVIEGAGGKLRRLRRVGERPAGVRQLAAAARYGFALIEATPERLRLRLLATAPDGALEELHCREYERARFADPVRRSRRCGGPAQPA